MQFIVAIDFDGTLVDHVYPDIGAAIPGAVEWCVKLQTAGAKLILWTMRSGKELDDAVKWCEANGIQLWGVNKNPQQSWSSSPKAFANLYVDDAAVGCPLRELPRLGARPGADWEVIGPLLMQKLQQRKKTYEESSGQ